MERIQADLNATLRTEGFDAAYRQHEVIDDAHRLYVAHFVVSVAQDFTAADSYTAQKGYVGFCVKSKRFLNTKTSLESRIFDALKDAWVINSISFEYAASWEFVYEVIMGGTLELRHILSPSDIEDTGGSVRQAIEDFNNDVASSLEHAGFTLAPRTIARRPKDNVYKFDVCRTEACIVTEDGVSGELALLKKGMNASVIPYLELKRGPDSFDGYVETATSMLECHDFGEGIELVRATLNLLDYDDDLYDYSDSLVY